LKLSSKQGDNRTREMELQYTSAFASQLMPWEVSIGDRIVGDGDLRVIIEKDVELEIGRRAPLTVVVTME
jgi:hypothetical protein